MNRQGWYVCQHDNGDVSITPINDTECHKPLDTNCSCKPCIEVIGAHLLIIHNAFDKREIEEWFDLAVKEVDDAR